MAPPIMENTMRSLHLHCSGGILGTSSPVKTDGNHNNIICSLGTSEPPKADANYT